MGPAPKKNVAPIAMPTTAAFPALQGRAAAARMSFVSNLNGNSPGEASLRIEFVAVDLNGDGDSTDVNEGFIRVYQDNLRPWYVTATLSGNPGPAGDIRRSPNCGAAIPGGAGVGTNGRFRTAADTNFAGAPSPRLLRRELPPPPTCSRAATGNATWVEIRGSPRSTGPMFLRLTGPLWWATGPAPVGVGSLGPQASARQPAMRCLPRGRITPTSGRSTGSTTRPGKASSTCRERWRSAAW